MLTETMMKAALTLLGLLAMFDGAYSSPPRVQAESQGTGADSSTEVITLLDLAAELNRLTDKVDSLEAEVVELKVELSVTNNEVQHSRGQIASLQTDVEEQREQNAAQDLQLETAKTEVANLKAANAEMYADLTTVRAQVINLTRENADLKIDLSKVKTRLDTSETAVETLKEETSTQAADLNVVKHNLTSTEAEVVNIRREIEEHPKVAFSAALFPSDAYLEAGEKELNVVFSEILTNVGQAYNSITGFFSAPVRGVYYFRFTVLDHLTTRSMNIRMVKNESQQIMRLSEADTDGKGTYLTGGVVLQLEVGDLVNLRLPANQRLYDNANHHSTFTGFLLFPLRER